MLTLSTDVKYTKGVGPKRASLLNKSGIFTVEDLLYYLPFRYEDRRNFLPIAELNPNQEATVSGKILYCGLKSTRRKNFTIFQMIIDDGSFALKAVWFNQPYLVDIFKVGQHIILYGMVSYDPYKKSHLQMSNPDYEVIESEDIDSIHMNRIVPIYRRIGNLSSKVLRKIIFQLLNNLEQIDDVLSSYISNRHNLILLSKAFFQVHFPSEKEKLETLNSFSSTAHKKLIFQEFFLLQAGLALRKNDIQKQRGIQFKTSEELREKLKNLLPFSLTNAQRRVFKEIVDDMRSPYPMHRMLQGDVGSGKTIVAMLAMLIAVKNGFQAALMAPTEILAEQHFSTINRLLKKSSYKIALLSRAIKGKSRKQIQQEIEEGKIDLIIGTHALIQEKVTFAKLGLAIIDEQHRFGVLQRADFTNKGEKPDVLVMSATPIPRSLALTVYGDLDLSIIDELPPGRQPIKTIFKMEEKRHEVYEFIRKQINIGHQIYIVYPLVEETEKSDLKAAVEGAEKLNKEVFPEYKIELMHGRMSSQDKESIMSRFAAGDIQILVATTVIEVGIDVPNANVIVIEHSERYGLSQLHQLRGRVGRGKYKSYCILLAQVPKTIESQREVHRRLTVLKESNDGFYIAEKDLEFRGPGEFFGTRQSGVPGLRVGNIIRDRQLMEEARKEAFDLINGKGHMKPNDKEKIIKYVKKYWNRKFGLMLVG
jgi:ATP-dependent DNA helicase RecG